MTAGGGVVSCPFCGGDAHMNGNSQDAQVFVVCDDCDATSDFYNTEAKALAAWNRRKPDARFAELIAADREYDEARREYDAKAPDGLGEMDSRTAADYARLNAATARRASALAALEDRNA